MSQAVRKPCFSISLPRGPNPRFPDAAGGAGAGAGRTLKSRSRPLPTHPGMKYFRKETLAVDKCHYTMHGIADTRLGWFGADFKTCLGFFASFIAPFGVRRGFKMILSHIPLTSLSMSSYRAIWTHFRSNFMILEQIKLPKFIYLNFQISGKLVLIRRETIFPKVVRLEKWCRTV